MAYASCVCSLLGFGVLPRSFKIVSMIFTSRNFMSATAGAVAFSLADAAIAGETPPSDEALRQAGGKPILDTKPFKSPVVIESIELLKKGKEHFVRVRSRDGAEGISVDDGRM